MYYSVTRQQIVDDQADNLFKEAGLEAKIEPGNSGEASTDKAIQGWDELNLNL